MTLSDFLPLMTTSVVVQSFSTRDAYGAVTYSTAASTYKARVVSKPTLVTNTEGQDVVAQHTAWIASTSRIGAVDKLTWNGSTYRIRAVETPTTGRNVHHNKVMFG